MDTITTHGRRAFTALTVTVAAFIATTGSVGCSSNGSGFDPMGGAGTGNTGSTAVNGGTSNQSNAMGGTGNTPTGTAGSAQPTGGSGPQGGAGPQGGTGPQGGDAPQGGADPQGGTGGTVDPGPVCPKPAGQICHTFLANDNSRNVVNYVDEFTSTNPGAIVWSKSVGVTSANSPRTIEIVDSTKAVGGKAILVSVDNGYVELGLMDGAKVAQVTVNFTGISGACRMPDGNTALGTNAAIRIVGPTGNQVRQFNLPAGPELRAINRNPATGNFWFSKTESIYEVSDQGQPVWNANMGAGTKGYAVYWREGGGAFATTGDPSTVIEIDGTGQILATVGGKATFNFLDFFSGFSRLANGNYVVANWLGHLAQPAADAPHVVEFSPDNKVVWQWGNQQLARQITNVYVLR